MAFEDWRADRCAHCNGSGLLEVWAGEACSQSMRECDRCIMGRVYVTPNDRLVLYPGGSIVGRDPGR